MPRKVTAYRPAPQTFGQLRVRVMAERGSHPDDEALPEDQRRWYWRVWRGDKPVAALKWCASSDVSRLVGEKYTATGDDNAPLAAQTGTVGALIDAFIAHVEGRADLRPRSKEAMRRNLIRGRDFLGPTRCSALQSLQAFQDHCVTHGATSSAKQMITLVLAAWRWGSEEGRSLCPSRPLKRPKLIQHRVSEKYTPSDSDVQATLDRMERGSWPWLALRIAERTGMRVHEISALRRSSLVGTILKVPDETKTGARPITIDDSLARDIRSYIAAHDAPDRAPLLGVALGAVRQIGVNYIDKACDAAGVHPFRIHGVRRGVVRRFVRAGVPLPTAAAHFGHSIQMMLEVYNEVGEDDHDDALALVTAFESRNRTPKKKGSVVTMTGRSRTGKSPSRGA